MSRHYVSLLFYHWVPLGTDPKKPLILLGFYGVCPQDGFKDENLGTDFAYSLASSMVDEES